MTKSKSLGLTVAKRVKLPLTEEIIRELAAGEEVLLYGVIYTARDAAHKLMAEMLHNNQPLPVDLKGQIIYYAGPCPEREGEIIGSAGPTTSGRMDVYAPLMLDYGLKGMIGKGTRNKKVKDSIIKNNAVYFAAIGGAGALIANSIRSNELIAFPELGTEAVRRLVVEAFPAYVAIDSRGNDLYELGKSLFKVI